MIRVTIKENSFIAKLAAKRLKSSKMAMVIGNTIYLHNSSKEDFLQNPKWVRHEIAHVHQFKQMGFLKFIFFYLLESFNKGYEKNSFEVEARQKERDAAILKNVQFI